MASDIDRDVVIESYAAFWWNESTGETDRWEDLDAEEREAVVENSCAELVAEWLTWVWSSVNGVKR